MWYHSSSYFSLVRLPNPTTSSHTIPLTPFSYKTVRETAGATLGRTQENLNYISLEELNYICKHPFPPSFLSQIPTQTLSLLP